MKALTTAGLTELIILIKNTFINKNSDVIDISNALAPVAITGAFSDLTGTSGVQTTSNLVTSVSSSSTDSQYPSAKLFYDTCGDIETLINAL